MAEGIARKLAQTTGRSIEIQSAGTLGLIGHPADAKAVQVCDELGISLRNHRSQAVTPELVAWADYVLVMETRHAMELRERFENLENRLVLLGSYGGVMDIADPIGGWTFQFRSCRDLLVRCVESFLQRLPD